MKVALIGLPQAGKRTLLLLLTGRATGAERKPGESVEGTAPIRDPRVDVLSSICRPRKTVYAHNQIVLCPDAVLDGSDRDWLESARRCDLLCCVVRGFDAPQVYHPAGTVDPERDRAALDAEAMLADMERIEKRLTRIAKEKRNANTPEQAVEEATLRKCMHTLEANTRLRDAGLQPFELRAIRSLEFLTLLPSLCAYNVSEPDAARRFAPPSVTVSALIEQEIMAIEDPADRAEYLRSMGLSESGLDRMNAAAHDAMGLMCFYTIGPDEARAWPIRKGTAAPEAGGKIHTDIQRGFIRVEIIKYDDLVAAGSESAARAAGKVQAKGRDYIIEDGDICHFLFSV